MRGNLFVVAAPSGTGKTSLVAEVLRRDPNVSVSVSHTTRPRRAQESDGIHYHFVSADEFQRLRSARQFLEDARVFDHEYGTSSATVERQLEEGKDVILEIDWQGARRVRDSGFSSRSIYILPPSLKELERRLRLRKQDSEEIIAFRMRRALSEIEHFDEFDYVIVNDEFEETVQRLLSIVQNIRSDKPVPVPNRRSHALGLLFTEP